MLARLAGRLADLAQRFVPDPFVIALGLTVFALALGWATMPAPEQGTRLGALAAGWLTRVTATETLAFTTQIALILVAGSALARTPPVRRLLARLAGLPRDTAGAAALTASVAIAGSLLNWGFGLVAGAVLAREIGARFSAARRPLDYPLVATAGFVAMMVWHGGLSGSAPLKVAEVNPLGGAPIPLDQTLFSTPNLVLSAALLLCVPWLFARMARPGAERIWDVAPLAPPAEAATEAPGRASGGGLLLLVVVLLGAVALADVFAARGLLGGLSLNVVIVLLLLVGLALFRSPQRYAAAFSASTEEAGGILLQFPFYFGILGLLEASHLVDHLAFGTADTARALAAIGLPLGFCYDLVTWLSACVVNMFVPSGGGQWAVQGPIVLRGAAELHLPAGRAVMALAWGDQWSNMLQPFWALPLLGLTGLRARDILGYALAIMLASGVLFVLAFALL